MRSYICTIRNTCTYAILVLVTRTINSILVILHVLIVKGNAVDFWTLILYFVPWPNSPILGMLLEII